VAEAVMRGFRSALVLVVVFAGLVAYIYFFESKRAPASESRDKVFSVSADEIVEIDVTSASGDRSLLRKHDAHWHLVEPDLGEADETESSALAAGLASLEVQRIVDEEPSDLAQYGLHEPRVNVAFRTSGDNGLRRLQLGDKTPTGGDMYARVGEEPRVFLVPAYLDNTFDRSTFDLRDKRILRFRRDMVESVEIVSGKQTTRLDASGDGWRVTRPFEASADRGMIDGLLTRLGSSQMRELLSSDAAALAGYGLARPSTTVILAAGGERTSIAFGGKVEGAEFPLVHARDLSRDLVFTVDASLAEDFARTPSEFRRKDLFRFRPFDATAVEVVQGGEVVAFEKLEIEGQPGRTWRRTAPSPGEIDPLKMDEFLSALSGLRAESFAESRRPAAALLATVTVKFDDGRQEDRVAFERIGDGLLASLSGEPGAAKVDSQRFDDAMRAVEALKQEEQQP
jgi:hypothetical protein